MNQFRRPNWTPKLNDDCRILVLGATGGLGQALVKMLLEGSKCVVGAHGASQRSIFDDKPVISITQTISSESDCVSVVESFASQAGGIDALVMLAGGIDHPGHWWDMPEASWEKDISVNLNLPFYVSRAAMAIMKDQGTGGNILLTGTESAIHGGSANSFPYAIAKRGTEAMVQGLAREGASHGILVNGVRLGYIASGFHQRWLDRTESDMEERANLVPLKRGGHPDEAAALMIYLLSGWSDFITGQMFPLTGGDWL